MLHLCVKFTFVFILAKQPIIYPTVASFSNCYNHDPCSAAVRCTKEDLVCVDINIYEMLSNYCSPPKMEMRVKAANSFFLNFVFRNES